MKATHLLAHYRSAPATEQAAFISRLMRDFETRGMATNYGACDTINLNNPRCPQCGNPLTRLIEHDLSHLAQEALIETDTQGVAYVAARCATIGDYHPAFFVTECCHAAVQFPPTTRIDFS